MKAMYAYLHLQCGFVEPEVLIEDGELIICCAIFVEELL